MPVPDKALHGTQLHGAVLCGGAGTRVHGADKPLLDWRGHPLIASVVTRLRPQVDQLWISANRNQARYAAYGTVVEDDSRWRTTGPDPTATPSWLGPLAGVASVARRIAANDQACELLIVPGDAPLLPTELAVRLALNGMSARYATTAAGPQPLHLRLTLTAALSVESYLTEGGRSVRGWLDRLRAEPVRFDDEQAFSNLNTPAAFEE